MPFFDLEKVLTESPKRSCGGLSRNLALNKKVTKLVQTLYTGACSSVRINNKYSEKFSVHVVLYQVSLTIPLLFIVVMDTLSWVIWRGCPSELLYAGDQLIADTTMIWLIDRCTNLKKSHESKGLWVNMKNTKVLFISSYAFYNIFALCAIFGLVIILSCVINVNIGFANAALVSNVNWAPKPILSVKYVEIVIQTKSDSKWQV